MGHTTRRDLLVGTEEPREEDLAATQVVRCGATVGDVSLEGNC